MDTRLISFALRAGAIAIVHGVVIMRRVTPSEVAGLKSENLTCSHKLDGVLRTGENITCQRKGRNTYHPFNMKSKKWSEYLVDSELDI